LSLPLKLLQRGLICQKSQAQVAAVTSPDFPRILYT
jgi:hypothetical protein